MKDIVIKANRVKKESFIFLICFAAAFIINVFSIIAFETSWLELITCLHIVIGLSVLLYAAAGIFRLLFRFATPR